MNPGITMENISRVIFFEKSIAEKQQGLIDYT